ncbi:MAG: hypothetical protein JXQ87_05630 [Bacteroidia bacterium]
MFKNQSSIGTNEVLSSSGIIAKAVAGGGALFTGIAIFLLMAILPESWVENKIMLFNTISVILMVAGTFMVIWSVVSLRKLKANLLEKKTLQIASKYHGVLTAAQLALEAKVNVSTADALLRKLQLKGIAEIDANEKGAICFKFHDLM